MNCKLQKLSTPQNCKFLGEPVASARDVIDLLCHSPSVVIHYPAATLSLNLGASKPQPSELCRVQKDKSVYISGARAI